MTKVVMIDGELSEVSENEAEAVDLYIQQQREEGLSLSLSEPAELAMVWKVATTKQRKLLTTLTVNHIQAMLNHNIAFSKRPDHAEWNDLWGRFTVNWVKNLSESNVFSKEIIAEARKAYAWYTREQE
jgi:hypothetical protein